MRVAVVGSGPSGVFSAQHLLARHPEGGIEVDVLDRTPAPFGLVRYGVAPDHDKIKLFAATLSAVLATPGVRFLGNVTLGTDVSLTELRAHYDAVVLAIGGSTDRRLSIAGEQRAGVYGAAEFVSWYNGHPDIDPAAVSLEARAAVVIGHGNVALDVCRVLARPASDLARTDVPAHVLETLTSSAVRDVYLVGRRGPVHTRFTSKELLELGEVEGLDILVESDGFPAADSAAALALEPAARRTLETLRALSLREPRGADRRLHVLFHRRPVEVLGDAAATGLRVETTTVDADGAAHGSGAFTTLSGGLIVRSVGYLTSSIDGIPLDESRSVVSNEAGRVLVEGAPLPGLYVVGWAKRGATGVIGSNRKDAIETVDALLLDLADAPPTPSRHRDGLLEGLAARGVPVVPWSGWQAIERAELALGVSHGRDRVKLHERATMLAAAIG